MLQLQIIYPFKSPSDITECKAESADSNLSKVSVESLKGVY